MYYGQNNQYAGNNNQPFFTAGAGNVSPNPNYFESEHNLDLTNQNNWNQPRDFRGLGSKAIYAPEAISGQDDLMEQKPQGGLAAENAVNKSNDSITPPLSHSGAPAETSSAISYRPHLIHADKEHLSSDTMGEINEAIAKLSQTDNISDFYSAIRGNETAPGMSQEYLKNSFSREVA